MFESYIIPSVEEYPRIQEELFKFINNYKDFDYLPEVILEFCSKNNYTPELIADVVSGNSSFILALDINCKQQGTFREIKKVKTDLDVEAW